LYIIIFNLNILAYAGVFETASDLRQAN